MPDIAFPSKGGPGPSKWALLRKGWFWLSLFITVVLIVPFFTPLPYFLWGMSSFAAFLEDNLGFNPALAEFFSIPFMFVYILALPAAVRWLLWPKRGALDVLRAFLAIMFVFGSKPLLLSIFQTEFSTDGTAQKCYVLKGDDMELFAKRRDGSCPTDPKSGLQTRPVTAEILDQQQRKLRPPRPIALHNPVALMQQARAGNPIQYFDAVTGDPKVWYDINDAGRFELYDNAGSSVISGRRLRPVSQGIVNQIQRQIERDYQRVVEARQKELANAQVSEAAVSRAAAEVPPQYQAAPGPASTAPAYKQPRTTSQRIERPAFVNEPVGQSARPSAAPEPKIPSIPIETPYKGD